MKHDQPREPSLIVTPVFEETALFFACFEANLRLIQEKLVNNRAKFC